MVSGPPCRQCGYPLRWFAQQNAWGCDRCRQMFPAQAQVPQPASAPPATGARANKKLAIGALVVLGAIITIAVVASRPSKKKADLSEQWIEQLQTTRDRVCACKDQACVQNAEDDLDAFRKAVHPENLNPTDDQVERGTAVRTAIDHCLDKLSGGDDDALAARHARDEAEAQKLRDMACACHDRACARHVTEELKSYYDAHASEPEVPATHKLTKLFKEMQQCFDRATGE